MTDAEPLTLRLLTVKQGRREFYTTVMNARDLFIIARSDILRLSDPIKPEYKGVQRPISKERVKEIQDYVSTDRSIFPNAIIISVDSRHIRTWQKEGDTHTVMVLERRDDSASVIDGQHRIAGLEVAPEGFAMNVSVFVDLDEEQKAEIFTKINSTQRPVNPSIAYQLFGYSSYRSPQRTAHRIAYTLNTTEGSPFYKRLKLLGTQDDFAKGTLSQATFARELLRLYTPNPRKDEYRLMRNEELESNRKYPLREEFRRGDDQAILKVVWEFFAGIAQTWPDQWAHQGSGNILNKTIGYVAWMGVLRAWLNHPTKSAEPRKLELLVPRLREIKDEYALPASPFRSSAASYGEAGHVRDTLISKLGLGATGFPETQDFEL